MFTAFNSMLTKTGHFVLALLLTITGSDACRRLVIFALGKDSY